MKIKKLLSSILSVALTASCIGSVMVSNVSAAYYNELSTIFEEDYDGETVTENSAGTGEIITDEATGNKYIKVSKGWSANQFSYAIPAISTGKIMVQFDYMKDEDNINYQTYFALANNNFYQPKEYIRLLSTNNFGTEQNKMMAFKAELIGSNSITKAGQWYTIVEVIDMDTKEATATLYEKGNPVALGTSYYEKLERTEEDCKNWPYTETNFVRLAHYGDADVCMDNISIKYVKEDPDIVFAEDYDGPTITGNVHGTGAIETDNSGNSYMHMNMTGNDWGATAFAYDIPTMSEGKYQIKFDYMTNATTDQSYMVLADSTYYSTSNWFRLLGASNGKFSVFGGSNNFSKGAYTYTPGTWYTQYVTVDMDTHKVAATLYEKGKNTPLDSCVATLTPRTGNTYIGDWPATSNSFIRLMHYGANDGYIDDIEIRKIPKDENVVFEEDYEDKLFTPIKSGTGNLVTDETTGNTYMQMTSETGWPGNSFGYKFPAISSGKISVEFDYMKDSITAQSYIALAPSNIAAKELLILTRISPDYGVVTPFVYADPYVVGKLTPKKWYTMKVTLDMETQNVTASLYNQGEETPLKTISATLEKTADDYKNWPETATEFVQLIHFGGYDINKETGEAKIDNCYIDNIKITQLYEIPELDSASVVIKTEDGTVQENYSEVSPEAKVITLDFGTTLDADTVTADSVYVTKKDSTDKIDATVACTGGVATITATNNWESGTYTIHATNTVANKTGDTLAENFEIDFTVPAKKIEAQIYDAYIGTGEDEKQITQYTQLKAGDELLLYSAVNIEGSAAKLIVAYYDVHGAMVKAESNDVTLSASTPIAYTVADCAASSVTFFLWDGFTNIAPLGTSFSLQN